MIVIVVVIVIVIVVVIINNSNNKNNSSSSNTSIRSTSNSNGNCNSNNSNNSRRGDELRASGLLRRRGGPAAIQCLLVGGSTKSPKYNIGRCLDVRKRKVTSLRASRSLSETFTSTGHKAFCVEGKTMRGNRVARIGI